MVRMSEFQFRNLEPGTCFPLYLFGGFVSSATKKGCRSNGKFVLRKIINNLVNKINQRVKAAG